MGKCVSEEEGKRREGIVGSEILMNTGRVDWLMSNLLLARKRDGKRGFVGWVGL